MRGPRSMLYIDSSALVKLVLPEAESDALAEILQSSAAEVASVLAAIEVPRAVARVSSDPAAGRRVDEILTSIDLREIDSEVVEFARSIRPTVRSLDAIHLATALSFGDELTGVVVYDRRLQDAVRTAGLDVLAPGQQGEKP